MLRTTLLIGGLITLFSIGNAHTAPISHPAGARLTSPGSMPPHLAISSTGNPATAAIEQSYFWKQPLRAGFMSNVSFGFEVGDTDDFAKRIDALARSLNLQSLFLNQLLSPSDTLNEDDINTLINALTILESDGNKIIDDFANRAYAKVTGGLTAPAAPLSFRSQTYDGVITLHFDVYGEARVGATSTGEAYQFNLDGVTDANDVELRDGRLINRTNGELIRITASSQAGLTIQGGIVGRLGAGYAREAWRNKEGVLHAGVTANLYRVVLARTGRLLNRSGTADAAIDDFSNNQNISVGAGLDIGAIWVAPDYSAGLTLRNVNTPSFNYPDVCSDETSDTCAFFRSNPRAARNGSSWTMERQLTMEATAYSENRRWITGLLLDANSVVDTTGDRYQWLVASVRYAPRRSGRPAPRVGYRKNLVSEKLDYISAGVTLFEGIHLDVSRSIKSTSFDNAKTPRALQMNLGIDFPF